MGLERDYYRVGGSQGVDGEDTQRGWGVDQNVVIGLPSFLNRAAQQLLAPEASCQRQLCPRKAQRRRYQIDAVA